MVRTTKTYYKILEVDPEASPEVIEAAYRRLARMYHPDVNRSPDATRRMQEINNGYGVLRDPQRRAAYDMGLQAEARTQATESAASTTTASGSTSSRTSSSSSSSSQQAQGSYRHQREETASTASYADSLGAAFAAAGMPMFCQRCMRSDATLRLAAFPYVVSFLILTFRQGDAGLYCEECRRRKMLTAKLISFLFGWWGLPWGFIYTLGVLFTSNQGKMDPKLNADYLRWLGAYFLRTGRLGEARRAFRASLNLSYDPELAGMVRAALGDDALHLDEQEGVTRWRELQWSLVAVVVVVVVWYALIAIIPPPSPRPTPSPIPLPTSTDIPAPTAVVERTELPPVPIWRRMNLAQGNVDLDLPPDWVVSTNEDRRLEIGDEALGLLLILSDNQTGADIGQLIDASKADPAVAEDYRVQMYDWLSDGLRDAGGVVLSMPDPKFRKFNRYDAIYFDVLVKFTEPSEVRHVRALLFMFDCEPYVCEAHAYKQGIEPFASNDWAIVQRLIGSIAVAR